MANVIWSGVIFVALIAVVIVLPRIAWYSLMSYSQRRQYARDVRLATSRGLRPPDPPPPPDLWSIEWRWRRIAAVLALAAGLIALVVLLLTSHR